MFKNSGGSGDWP